MILSAVQFCRLYCYYFYENPAKLGDATMIVLVKIDIIVYFKRCRFQL